jgi:hypothetical protein
VFDPYNIEDLNLDAAIDSAFADLKSFSADEDGYRNAVSQLTQLYRLKHEAAQLNLQAQQQFAAHELAASAQQLAHDESRWQEEQAERTSWFERVEPSTVVTVAGNLLVALIVVKYEQTGVISSQVRNFMRKI